MGKQKGIILTGNHGGISYYLWKGIPCMRMAPGKRKVTGGSIHSSAIFGRARKISSLLRSTLIPLLPQTGKRWLMYRMDSVVQEVLHDASKSTSAYRENIQALQQFSLTEKSSFQQLFKKPIDVCWLPQGPAKIRVPACTPMQDIKAPAHTLSVDLCFMLLSCDTSSGSLNGQVIHTLQLPYDNGHLPSQEFDLPYSGLPAQLSMVAVSIRYSMKPGKQLPLNEELKWMPAMVAGGIFEL